MRYGNGERLAVGILSLANGQKGLLERMRAERERNIEERKMNQELIVEHAHVMCLNGFRISELNVDYR